MVHTLIYDIDTRAILVLNPPVDEAGAPVLPDGVNSGVAEIPDVELAKLSTPNASFRLAIDGSSVEVVPVEAPPPLAPTLPEQLAVAIASIPDTGTVADIKHAVLGILRAAP